MKETKYGLEIYYGNGINSNAIIDPRNKIYFDASGAMPRINEAFIGFITHDHPDHVRVTNLKGTLYLSENNDSLIKPTMNSRVNHSRKMLKDELGIYPGILGSKAFLYPIEAYTALEYIINKNTYDKVNALTFRNEQIINDITCYIVGGHSPDSTVFTLERENKKIGITGDTLFRNYLTNSFKTRDASLSDSINADMTIANLGLDVIIPGHGPLIEGKQKIKEMYINAMNWELNEQKIMTELTRQDNGTSMKEIKRLRGYEGRSDNGYGRPYAFAIESVKQGRIIIKNKRLIATA